jgi:uncharacterized protein (DUF1800 family)
VLTDLARHPPTAKHVATKLARHFVADDPAPPLVDKLTQRFLDTDGDLKEMAKTLVTAPESWTPERAKIKRPGEWIVAALRAAGLPGDVRRINPAQALLGEPLWRPPAPKGFSDDNATWLDGLTQRLDIANAFAQRPAPRSRSGCRGSARPARLDGDAPRHRRRREQAAGAGVPTDGA